MKALVLEKAYSLKIIDMPLYESMGPDEVRIAIKNVGICGSDLHYYTNGGIGEYVVKEPMVLGHEAAGIITETGSNVTELKVGDRVCMEPGIPDALSRETKLGLYNLDPAVVFWATPPVHGCLCESVVHPASFTYKLPENVSYAEGAMVEPLAIGMQAASKAALKPGSTALVLGAGTIGLMTALSALSGGCSRVFIADVNSSKLAITDKYKNLIPVNLKEQNAQELIMKETDNWGVDVLFEATGNPAVFSTMHEYVCPGGCLVLIGIPADGKAEISITGIQAKELRMESVFRYAHQYDKTIKLIASGDIDINPMISKIFDFKDSIEAYETASVPGSSFIKIQIAF